MCLIGVRTISSIIEETRSLTRKSAQQFSLGMVWGQ